MAQGKTQLNLKKIHAITRESIDATDGRGDGWRTNSAFHELSWHSRAELKIALAMLQRKQQLKCERNSRIGTDIIPTWTDDGQRPTYYDLCKKNQAELKSL